MTASDVVGLPREFQWRGQKYQVCPRDMAMEFAFVAYLRGLALDEINRHRDRLGEEGYRQALAVWQHEGLTEEYEFGGELCHRALWYSAHGGRQMLFLKLRKGMERYNGAVVTRATVDEMAADPDAWRALCQLTAEQDLPNPPAPAPPPQEPAGA